MYNFFIVGDEIKQTDQMGQQVLVGYTLKAYNELLEIAEKYKKKLEDAGLIQKQLTPEEMQAKQNELMQKMIDKFETFDKRLSGLEEALGGTDD